MGFDTVDSFIRIHHIENVYHTTNIGPKKRNFSIELNWTTHTPNLNHSDSIFLSFFHFSVYFIQKSYNTRPYSILSYTGLIQKFTLIQYILIPDGAEMKRFLWNCVCCVLVFVFHTKTHVQWIIMIIIFVFCGDHVILSIKLIGRVHSNFICQTKDTRTHTTTTTVICSTISANQIVLGCGTRWVVKTKSKNMRVKFTSEKEGNP